MDFKQNLLDAANAHCKARGISLARLSTIVVNDGKFFPRLEGGGGFTVETYQKFMNHFADSEATDAAA